MGVPQVERRELPYRKGKLDGVPWFLETHTFFHSQFQEFFVGHSSSTFLMSCQTYGFVCFLTGSAHILIIENLMSIIKVAKIVVNDQRHYHARAVAYMSHYITLHFDSVILPFYHIFVQFYFLII